MKYAWLSERYSEGTEILSLKELLPNFYKLHNPEKILESDKIK